MQINFRNTIILCSLLIASSCMGAFIYSKWLQPQVNSYSKNSIKVIKASQNELLISNRMNNIFTSSSPTSFIDAAKESIPSVVYIRTTQKSDKSLDKDAYSLNSGSGVIVSSEGFIVTNNHVIENSNTIEVVLNDNREYKAKVIGQDPYTDLALIKIDAENLPFLLFGNSDSLQVGEWVLAVGNPFRLNSTVTAGIVSAKGRNINILENKGIESFIQTDAAVNQGNSGGALVNSKSLLMGINTAIMTKGGGYEGFSFAIPSNLAKKIVTDLKEFGAVQRGWIGLELQNMDSDRAEKLSLADISGVYIALVVKNGAAYDAGIKTGDVINSLNGQKIDNVSHFMEKIGQFRPGDKVSMEVFRSKTIKKHIVTLRNQLNTTDLVAIRKDPILRKVGFELRELDSYEKTKFKTQGVMVVSVNSGSLISNSNLEPGLIITKLNNKAVKTVNEITNFLEHYKGNVIIEGFYENYPGEYPYSFRLD